MRLNQPDGAKDRADEIAGLVFEACEKLTELSREWFALNDREGMMDAQRMLSAKEVTLMVSARVEKGLGHIALNLLRCDSPMPRPFFEVQVPMTPFDASFAGLLWEDAIPLKSRARKDLR